MTKENEKEWKFSDGLGEAKEDEIIELVDVVEEPEPQLSIHQLMPLEEEEPTGDIPPLESWEKLFKEEKGKVPEEEIKLSLEGTGMKPVLPGTEMSSQEGLFEKIEIEDIFEKVEELKSSAKRESLLEEENKVLEEWPTPGEEEAEKLPSLEEFETALRAERKPQPLEEKLERLVIEKPKLEAPAEVAPAEIIPEPKEPSELEEEELPELLEEMLEEEEIGLVEEMERGRPEGFEAEPPSEIFAEAPPLTRIVERQMEEVIARGIQGMMEDFITKVVPEMTQNIVNLTMERIETMVKEIVPDLAEKAIQEEIQRLKKGEKR